MSVSRLATSVADDGTKRVIENPWLLVFDLDGTLIDSSRDLCASINATLAHLGRLPLPPSLISSFIGDGAAALVQRALQAGAKAGGSQDSMDVQTELFSDAFAYFLSFYRLHKLDTTVCYPGVLEALTTIRERHPRLPLAVLTNKPVNPSREICAALGLSQFFFANYGGDSFSAKKPSAEGLFAVMDEARALHAEGSKASRELHADGVVMIGDSAADVLVARACGARSVGCLYGLAAEELRQAAPDFHVNHFAELLSILEI